MGSGAIFIGRMAEITIPTVLIFAVTYVAAKNSLKLRPGNLGIAGFFLLTLIISGALYAGFYSHFDQQSYGMFAIFAIPLLVSLGVLCFLAPRAKFGDKP